MHGIVLQNWTQLQDREQQQTAPPLTQLNLGVTKTDSQGKTLQNVMLWLDFFILKEATYNYATP